MLCLVDFWSYHSDTTLHAAEEHPRVGPPLQTTATATRVAAAGTEGAAAQPPAPIQPKFTLVGSPLYLAKAFFTEFAATYLFVLFYTGVIVFNPDSVLAQAIIVLMIGIAISAAFGFSGAVCNPWITLGLWFARVFTLPAMIAWIIIQLGAAAIASLTLQFLLGGDSSGLGASQPGEGIDTAAATVTEIIGMAAIMFIVFQSVRGPIQSVNINALRIWLTISAAILFATPISGASFNIARTFGM